MKKDIHPKYYHDAQVICACGKTFTTGSILPEIRVEICSACHPFFTGQQKLIDTEGRVEKFTRRQKLAQTAAVAASKRVRQKKGEDQKEKAQPKTLREMLETTR